ncbi:MAG: hypothetical protein V9G10_03355 [Candidatus Nanopelagicales bacterium]
MGFAGRSTNGPASSRWPRFWLAAICPAGDFVRWCKQVIDCLGQIAAAAAPGDPVREVADRAADSLRRGVVDYSSEV